MGFLFEALVNDDEYLVISLPWFRCRLWWLRFCDVFLGDTGVNACLWCHSYSPCDSCPLHVGKADHKRVIPPGFESQLQPDWKASKRPAPVWVPNQAMRKKTHQEWPARKQVADLQIAGTNETDWKHSQALSCLSVVWMMRLARRPRDAGRPGG